MAPAAPAVVKALAVGNGAVLTVPQTERFPAECANAARFAAAHASADGVARGFVRKRSVSSGVRGWAISALSSQESDHGTDRLKTSTRRTTWARSTCRC